MDHQDVQHQQKDYINNLFISELGADRGNESHHPSMYGGALPSPSPSTMSPSNPVIPNVPLNLDLVTQLIGLQGQQAGSIGQGQYSPQLLLEQRLKLNQLQQLQLQNQILQQQLEFLNGQGTAQPIEGSGERQKPQNPFVGLPTPINSTELHAQSSPSTDYISPITLGYVDTSHFRSNSQSQLPPDMHLPPHHISVPNDTRTAPADLVFDTTPSIPLPSPGELEFDLSPLSPWMDPYNPDTSQQPRRKRTASPHGEEQVKVARQRPSPTPRVPPTPNSTKRGARSTKSASSTPLLRSSRAGGRKNSTSGDIPGDSPSPVDLSMPPPGAPASQLELNASSSHVNMPVANSSPTSATGRAQQQITPVTPASIMNLGGLGMNSGLTPPTHAVKFDAKGKSAGRGKDSSSSVPTSKKGNGVPLVSPSLKPILPAGNISASNALASSSLPSPVLRKSSHKAAEQKRRDSLKTTFDELRTLLPPIPLPSEDCYPDEPVLPGAMPPRGPPRGNADGPNRSISKLQLLRCGNDYIRLLQDKIASRDNEIALLRSEIRRLRGFMSEDMWREGAEEIDLNRDVDFGELGPWRRSMTTYDGDDGEEDMPE